VQDQKAGLERDGIHARRDTHSARAGEKLRQAVVAADLQKALPFAAAADAYSAVAVPRGAA
jgi:hypothetical protein